MVVQGVVLRHVEGLVDTINPKGWYGTRTRNKIMSIADLYWIDLQIIDIGYYIGHVPC